MRSHILYITLALAFFMTVGNQLMAQTLDEIIDAHIKAHGGAENWDKVENMKITGKFTAFSLEDDFLAIITE